MEESQNYLPPVGNAKPAWSKRSNSGCLRSILIILVLLFLSPSLILIQILYVIAVFEILSCLITVIPETVAGFFVYCFHLVFAESCHCFFVS